MFTAFILGRMISEALLGGRRNWVYKFSVVIILKKIIMIKINCELEAWLKQ
jgi:hypothetical protein